MAIITFDIAFVVFIMRLQQKSLLNYLIYFPMYLGSHVFLFAVFFLDVTHTHTDH